MKKLVIKKIEDYDYTMVDSNNDVYIKNFEFFSNYKPCIGDIVYIDDKILKEDNMYNFDEIYNTSNYLAEEIIKVVHNDDEYYFQRRYG